MKIKAIALSFTVKDVSLSSRFLKEHFGFSERLSTENFSYLFNESIDFPIIFMQKGIEVLPQSIRHQEVSGMITAFTVDDIEAELKRLTNENVTISAPLQDDPWGERLFQVTDPNGIVYQLVQWVEPSDEQYAGNNPGQWK
jgi:predicted enzyme related to lactoylglutathione lyase